MNKSYLLILLVILLIIPITRQEPVDLSVSLQPCIGGTICFVGEILKLNIKLNPSDTTLMGKEKDITIESDIFNTKYEKIIVGNETKVEIPMSLSINEGPYTIIVNSNLEDAGKFLLKIKHFLWEIVGGQYSYSTPIEVRYPKVFVEDLGYQCNNAGFYIEEIKLKLEEPVFNEMECKIKIYTDNLVTTNHELVKENQFNENLHYYETNYSKINKADLTGSIQKINFIAGPAIQQTNTKLVPVCLIDGRDVEIKPSEKPLKRCYVNGKSVFG